jgi:uncharacterized protein (UPF0262 family)
MTDIFSLTLEAPAGIQVHPLIAQERDAALHALTEERAVFRLRSGAPAPYQVRLGVEDNRLRLCVAPTDHPEEQVWVPVAALRGVIKDYFLMCEGYFKTLNTPHPAKLEAMDMGRRGVHNQGAAQLQSILKNSVTVDEETARRLFTLVCVLHLRKQSVGLS